MRRCELTPCMCSMQPTAGHSSEPETVRPTGELLVSRDVPHSRQTVEYCERATINACCFPAAPQDTVSEGPMHHANTVGYRETQYSRYGLRLRLQLEASAPPVPPSVLSGRARRSPEITKPEHPHTFANVPAHCKVFAASFAAARRRTRSSASVISVRRVADR